MNIESISSESLSKEMAYLFGVYLTDGSISYVESYSFSLKTIDQEFAKNTLESIKKLIPTCNANIYTQQPRTRYWEDGSVSETQLQYCINVGFAKLGSFFKQQTGDKHHIPLLMWNAKSVIKKWFIAGVMDGDGWISKTDRKNYLPHYEHQFQYRIGIGGVSEGWVWEFEKLLQQFGVQTLKPEIYIRQPKNKPMVRFGIKAASFVDNGLFFTIKRKQDRLLSYKLRNVQRLNAAHPTG